MVVMIAMIHQDSETLKALTINMYKKALWVERAIGVKKYEY
tara:strand:+ start:324 stop:446 length:123 start_codon:yes stop_codon:yes gene_type:complete